MTLQWKLVKWWNVRVQQCRKGAGVFGDGIALQKQSRAGFERGEATKNKFM